MKKITIPLCDVRPGDHFERYRSQRTGAFLVYRYRRVRGTGTDEALLVATFHSQAEATKARNAYRREEERLRVENDYVERLQVWAGLEGVRA